MGGCPAAAARKVRGHDRPTALGAATPRPVDDPVQYQGSGTDHRSGVGHPAWHRRPGVALLLITPGVALVIVMTLVLIGGLVAFGLSRKSSETTASDKGDNPAAVDSGTVRGGHHPGTANLRRLTGGTRAELCAKGLNMTLLGPGCSTPLRRKLARPPTSVRHRWFRSSMRCCWYPPDLYFQMANLRYHANQMGTPPEPDRSERTAGCCPSRRLVATTGRVLTPESNVTEVAAVFLLCHLLKAWEASDTFDPKADEVPCQGEG